MSTSMLYLTGILLIIATILFVVAGLAKRKTGIPTGRVIYSDTNKWGKVEQPLYDPELRLTGKPDYLVRVGVQIIPVEVKSGRATHEPHEWHIFQLAAYCLLVEHEFGLRPPYGILHYSNRTFAIDFTNRMKASTVETIRTMQKRTSQIQIERSHHEQVRCQHCGYRSVCDQALRI